MRRNKLRLASRVIPFVSTWTISICILPFYFLFFFLLSSKVKSVLCQQSVWVGIAELLAVLQAGGRSLWLCQQRTVPERLLPLSLPGHSGIALWSIKLLHKRSWRTSLGCLDINGIQKGSFWTLAAVTWGFRLSPAVQLLVGGWIDHSSLGFAFTGKKSEWERILLVSDTRRLPILPGSLLPLKTHGARILNVRSLLLQLSLHLQVLLWISPTSTESLWLCLFSGCQKT